MNQNNANANPTIVIHRRGEAQLVYVGAKVMMQVPGMTWWNGTVVAIRVATREVRVEYEDWGNQDEVEWHAAAHIVNVII